MPWMHSYMLLLTCHTRKTLAKFARTFTSGMMVLAYRSRATVSRTRAMIFCSYVSTGSLGFANRANALKHISCTRLVNVKRRVMPKHARRFALLAFWW